MRTASGSARRAMRWAAHKQIGLPLFVALTALGLGAAEGAQKHARVPSASPSLLDLQAQVKATATKTIPSVVNIASTVVVREQAFSDEGLPFGLIPELPPRRQYGQGSGVIVSADGYIITNNHVVADAIDVDVLLSDRRQFKGRVGATDPKTDGAVVKIEAGGLSPAPMGESSRLAVGDCVVASGSPLGLTPAD